MIPRSRYASSPRWIVIGDSLAIILAGIILLGGVPTNAYVDNPDWRSLAWIGCAILGAWGILGWVAGRWDGPERRTLRLVTLLFVGITAVCGLQLIPLPASLVESLQPEWKASLETLRSVGMEAPDRVPLAHVPERALRSWDQMVAALFFFIGVAMPASRGRSGRLFLWVVAGFSVLEGLLALSSAGTTGRVSGAIYNPNHSAAAIILGLPAFAILVHDGWKDRSLGYQSMSSDWRTMLMILLGGGALIGWLATLSRGSLLLAGCVVAFWLMFEITRSMAINPNQRRRMSRGQDGPMVLVAVILVLIVGAFIVYEAFFSRLSELEAGRASRMDSWRATLIGLRESNFMGLGLGGAEFAMKRFERSSGAEATVWSHNDYVQIIAETGILGIIVIVVLGFLILRSLVADWRRRSLMSWERRRLCRAAWAGCTAVMLHAAVDFHLRIPTIGLAFVGMLAVALQSPDWPRAGGKTGAGEWESDEEE
jgi:O-antigen ligase